MVQSRRKTDASVALRDNPSALAGQVIASRVARTTPVC